MRAFVITIMDMPRSVEVAERCIASAAEFGVEVEKFHAVTPAKVRLEQVFRREGFPLEPFTENPYSRAQPCMATFLSHCGIWKNMAERGEDVLILEHDAVFHAPLPDLSAVDGLCNFGRPSFGSFRTPPDGIGPLHSKVGGYMPGAHAYYVTPSGAARLLERISEAEPTDVFLNINRFPWIQEYHPWPIHADDSFTTIQTEIGCRAKHNKVEVV